MTTAQRASRLAMELGACVLLAGVFAFLGVYDSDAMPLAFRFVFWFVLMAAGALALSIVEPVVDRVLPDDSQLVRIAVTSLLIAIPLTIGLVGLNTDMAWSYSAKAWLLQYVGVMTIAVVVVSGRSLVRAFANGPHVHRTAQAVEP